MAGERELYWSNTQHSSMNDSNTNYNEEFVLHEVKHKKEDTL